MRAHTITTKARAGARARAKPTIVPGGILALSLAVVLVAATASSAGAERGPTGDAHRHRGHHPDCCAGPAADACSARAKAADPEVHLLRLH
jgi:hypothetical protein